MDQHHESPKLGSILIKRGVLTEIQVKQILEQQRKVARPFGDLAERMFGVDPEAVEKAWIEQYLTISEEVDLDLQRIDIHVLRVLNRRQAWQFRMLPLRREGEQLVAATSADQLSRAVNFSWRRLNEPIYFLIARRPQLERFLMEHYPWPAALELKTAG
jgi:hypothetical protein